MEMAAAQESDYGAAVRPVRATERGQRKGYSRWAIVTAVAAATTCLVFLARGGAPQENGGSDSALAGAYYAVAKPPAFNFNRELVARHCSLSVVRSDCSKHGDMYC
jgi:hypothetical protein